MIYGLIVARGLRLHCVPRAVGKLLATGLSFALALQVSPSSARHPAVAADRPHHPIPVARRFLADL